MIRRVFYKLKRSASQSRWEFDRFL